MRIEFKPSEDVDHSPENKPSYSRAEFHSRFKPWNPDWSKPVVLDDLSLEYDDVPLAALLYESGEPTKYTNNPTVLLFESEENYRLIRSDYYTRLLFTEQDILGRQFQFKDFGLLTMEQALANRRDPGDPFWAASGLPGVPLAIGVNGSLRLSTGRLELLAYKRKSASGGMGETVGPPVSASLTLDGLIDKISGISLGDLVVMGFTEACKRELRTNTAPNFAIKRSWLDSNRGYKPEVNFVCVMPDSRMTEFCEAIRLTHAGVVLLEDHLTEDGCLSTQAENALATWGLNFQAWFLWER